ncbi:MAG TPA: alpha/beta hydrolase [Myxococcota bacterium]|nr:alpha/beta hydrolase [Myxococcota bacterium]
MQMRKLALRGMEFGLIEAGSTEGPPLVLLHGWQDQAAIWVPFIQALLQHGPHRIVAMDLRGFGQSEHNAPGSAYAFAEYLVDLDHLLDHYPGPVTLVAHSMGGTIASLYAGLRPERVARLVLVDGLGIPDGLDGTVHRMREHLDGYKNVLPHKVFASVEDMAHRLMRANAGLSRDHAQMLAERVSVRTEAGWIWRWDPRHRVRLAVPYRQDQHLRVLAEITAPTLLVVPERVGFPVEDLERLAAAIRHVQRRQLADCGHMLHVEQPEALAAAVHGFLFPDRG